MSASRSDYDSPWKEILRQYFQQAIGFFFPQTSALIDWQRPYEFLDKEFQQIILEAEVGRRYADQLVKVWLLQGQEVWLCVHLEVQAERETDFAQRIFIYNTRIFQLYHRPAISLAILCDNNRRWRPNSYEFAFPGTSLHFQFDSVKLLDYQTQMEFLETSDNPFAVVVLAHLQAQATRKDSQQRKQAKLALMRHLYERGYNRQQVLDLFRFIDWVLTLPEALKQEFWQDLRTFEEECRMPYITSIEQIGFERGIEQGEKSLILRLLTRRVGALSPMLQAQVEELPLAQLEALGEALLDFSGQADLEHWLTTTLKLPN
ncbi:MAG: DUF4351 domain-containing protein [Aphanocapsa sp. GSE-SYN-MK-11-07L]|jgi:hypothetical protein|nr:DUF4351 domain-containing protein [Aphanocapsa sp. GSE-SYN-MK-11-07L]